MSIVMYLELYFSTLNSNVFKILSLSFYSKAIYSLKSIENEIVSNGTNQRLDINFDQSATTLHQNNSEAASSINPSVPLLRRKRKRSIDKTNDSIIKAQGFVHEKHQYVAENMNNDNDLNQINSENKDVGNEHSNVAPYGLNMDSINGKITEIRFKYDFYDWKKHYYIWY